MYFTYKRLNTRDTSISKKLKKMKDKTFQVKKKHFAPHCNVRIAWKYNKPAV